MYHLNCLHLGLTEAVSSIVSLHSVVLPDPLEHDSKTLGYHGLTFDLTLEGKVEGHPTIARSRIFVLKGFILFWTINLSVTTVEVSLIPD